MADERFRKFFDRRTSELYGEDGLPENCHLLHRALINSLMNDFQGKAKLRRASMCLDGTPVVYSLKSTRNADVVPFRMLVEPGGLGITVLEQINISLRVVDELLHKLGWEFVLHDLNAVISRVFPWDADTTRKLWGGIWLGCDLSKDDVQLRLYLNLRYDEALCRWQRLADVLTWFSEGALAAQLKMSFEQISLYAIPVGLGLVISEQIHAIRLYVGVQHPNHESMLKAGINKLHGSERDVGFVCRSFTDAFGPFIQQSVTLGYDFILDKGRLMQPEIKRTKIDISCQLIKRDKLYLLIPLIIDLVRYWNLDDQKLNGFLEDITECFGGFEIEFISLGFVEGLEHITTYVKPHGFKNT
ncbi:MAG: hypothetical protein NT002_10960 [candidate division Zixibacteria bacterium]|nr:hypothetical protein [candidate division Zixibacteria bacterium]